MTPPNPIAAMQARQALMQQMQQQQGAAAPQPAAASPVPPPGPAAPHRAPKGPGGAKPFQKLGKKK